MKGQSNDVDFSTYLFLPIFALHLDIEKYYILTGPGHEGTQICLPFTGASESVSPCFRFRITLLLGSPSSIKLVSYPVMTHQF